MSLLISKSPVTPSQRHVVLLDKKNLKKTNILKSKSCSLKNNAGRNNKGRITVFKRGGGHKKKYRIIFDKNDSRQGIVENLEYDPYRSANIARIYCDITNVHFYILAPEGLKRGDFIDSQIGKSELNFKIGNLFHLKDLPLGFVYRLYQVENFELLLQTLIKPFYTATHAWYLFDRTFFSFSNHFHCQT